MAFNPIDDLPAGSFSAPSGMFGYKRPSTGNRIIGALADAAAAFGGASPQYGPAIEQQRSDAFRQQQLEAQNARADAALAAKLHAPQVQNLGNGGIAQVQDGQVSILRQPDAPQPGQTERLLAAWKALPDGDPQKALIARILPGYGYTPEAVGAKTAGAEQIEGVRQDNRIALKGVPTYAATHPSAASASGSHVTATARARYINEAEAAIARGAPRAAVYARLAKMGIQ